MREIHLGLLETRYAESQLFCTSLRKTSFYVEGKCDELTAFSKRVIQLRQRVKRLSERTASSSTIKQLLTLVDEYEQAFEVVVENARERGFKDWGHVGHFRAAIHEFERAIDPTQHQELLIELLQLRRAEKDYLLRHEQLYVDRVFSHVRRLKRLVSILEPAHAVNLQKHLDNYRSSFVNVVTSDATIGMNATLGVYQTAQDAATKIQDITETIVMQADVDLQTVRKKALLTTVLIVLLGTAVATVASALLSRTMTQPLCELVRATNRVAHGELCIPPSIHTTDEIGELAKSFGEMVAALRDIAKVANELSSGNYTANVVCQGGKDILGTSLANMAKALRDKSKDNRRKTAELEHAMHGLIRFRAALDASADAVYLIDRGSMKLVDLNEAACTMTGYTRHELFEMTPIRLLWPTASKSELADLLDDLATAKTDFGALDTFHQRKDGSTFPVEVVVRLLSVDDQPFIVAAARDLTERKQHERQLEHLHRQLLDAARESGKAEIATNVLHNVGNVLNSINISTELVISTVKYSRIRFLFKAVQALQAHEDNLSEYLTRDERGRHLPSILVDLIRQLKSEQELIHAETTSLLSSVEHIKAIIQTQQSYAKCSSTGAVECVALVDLLEDAIRVNTASMKRHSINVDRRFEDLGPVFVDKHRLLLIVVNLISNAKYACLEVTTIFTRSPWSCGE